MNKFKKGFTLIELLVAIGILSIVLITSSGVLFLSLKSKQKTLNLSDIKQSGFNAMQMMNIMIRNSQSISGACASGTSISIVNLDGNTTTFSCTGDRIASASASVDYLTSGNMIASSCIFNCNRILGKPDIVTIKFTLSKGVSSSFDYASQNFQSMTTLRKY